MSNMAPDMLRPARKHFPLTAIALLALSLSGGIVDRADAEDLSAMKIRFDYDGTPVVATLEDNATSRSFVKMLPLTVKLEDYAATEKIANLPGPLDTSDAPAGLEPKAGDVTLYAPWGNLAIFIKDFRYASGLVKLGHIDEGLDALKKPGSVEVTIERTGD